MKYFQSIGRQQEKGKMQLKLGNKLEHKNKGIIYKTKSSMGDDLL